MRYRVGKKQKRTILYVESGKEYLQFPQGSEDACQKYCDFLNGQVKKQQTDHLITFFMGVMVGLIIAAVKALFTI